MCSDRADESVSTSAFWASPCSWRFSSTLCASAGHGWRGRATRATGSTSTCCWGLAAPFVIALHSSFKFHGFAGMAFWIMLAVSISGVIGRYLYGQIPRRVNAAEISRKELQETHEKLAAATGGQRLLPKADLGALLRLPSQERVESLPMFVALGYMMFLDVCAAYSVWPACGVARWASAEKISTFGGFPKDAPHQSGNCDCHGAGRCGYSQTHPVSCHARNKSSTFGMSSINRSATHSLYWRWYISAWSWPWGTSKRHGYSCCPRLSRCDRAVLSAALFQRTEAKRSKGSRVG